MDYSRVATQLFTVPPNMGALSVVLFVGRASDKWHLRGPLMLVGCTVATVGCTILIASEPVVVQYGNQFLVASGMLFRSPLVMSWFYSTLARHYMRTTGSRYQIVVAYMAAFIDTVIYLPKDS